MWLLRAHLERRATLGVLLPKEQEASDLEPPSHREVGGLTFQGRGKALFGVEWLRAELAGTGIAAWDVVMGKLVKDMTPEQRERRRASAKRWYEENRERRLTYLKHWREEAREQRRAYHERYYKENREHYRARKKFWYENNREHLKEYRRQYRARQKELKAESP